MKALPLPLPAWASALLLSFPYLATGQSVPSDPASRLIYTKDTSICSGRAVPIRTTTLRSFRWQPAGYLDDPASPNPVANPPVTTTYFLTAMVPSAVNLVRNGNFSEGNKDFTSGYTYDQVNRTEGEYCVGPNPRSWNRYNFAACGDHTTGNGNMLIVNGSTYAGTNIWSQRVSVLPGKTYALSAWIESVSRGNPAVLQFSINGIPVGNVVHSTSATCSWQPFNATWSSGRDTVAVISVVDMNTLSSSNDFALDDISFTFLGPVQDSITISVYPAPHIQITPDIVVCRGKRTQLQLSVSNGGSCTWSPASFLDDASSFTPLAAPTSDTLFRVTITDGNGCTEKDSVKVQVLSNPVIRVTKAHDIDCSQPVTQLSATGASSYSWSPAAGLSDTNSASPTVSIDTTTTYVVTGTDSNGCYASGEVTVRVMAVGKELFIVPNAFTPNGDGHNDRYGIQRWGDVQVEEFSIFNRAGVRVFTSRGPSAGWDGNFNGHPQPTGGYVYVIRAKTFCGPVTRSGTLMLVR